MKVRNEQFNINSNKVDEKKKIITLADLHLSLSLNKKILKAIKVFLDCSRDSISFIAMPGDIMYAYNYGNNEYVRRLECLLASFSEMKTPIVMSLGNHDIQSNEEKARRLFRDLERIPNVYPLDNEQIQIDGMNVTGFSPSHDVYKSSWHGKKANETFVREFLESKLNFDDKDFNVLLNHAPHPIASDYSKKMLKDIIRDLDLIISGHLHNGFIPEIIEKKLKNCIKDYGIWEKASFFPPKFFGKINLCRGMHDVLNAKLVISKGVRPYIGYISARIPITPNVTEININPMKKIKQYLKKRKSF